MLFRLLALSILLCLSYSINISKYEELLEHIQIKPGQLEVLEKFDKEISAEVKNQLKVVKYIIHDGILDYYCYGDCFASAVSLAEYITEIMQVEHLKDTVFFAFVKEHIWIEDH